MSCLLACSVDFEIRIMRFSPTLRHDTPFHAVQIALVEVSVKDFAQFHEFYAGELLNGRALSRTMGLDVVIVAFHPDCSLIFEAVNQHWFDWHECKMGIWRTWFLGESAKTIPVKGTALLGTALASENHLSTFQPNDFEKNAFRWSSTPKIMMCDLWNFLNLPRCSLKSTIKLEISQRNLAFKSLPFQIAPRF